MMGSDSDESDYEDARQHHDNQPDDHIVSRQQPSSNAAHRAVIVSSSFSPNQGESNQVNQDTPEQGRQQVPDEINVGEVAEPLNNGDNAPAPVENENNQNADEAVNVNADNLENQNDEAVNPPENDGLAAVDDQRVLIRLQGYFRDNPNPVVVDSDDDDVDTISDDSELDFPMIVREGERGASSDENEILERDIDEDLQEFDQELPIRHAYLGEGMEELQGRIVLEEDATPEIPLIAMGIHLIPGQTLPLTIFHAVFQNAIRRCVMTDRLFGIVHNDMEMPTGNVVYKGALGTLAEIFEYQEESDGDAPGGMSSSFALKAKGRQRFNVLDVRRQADGNLMGRVRIRPEIKLTPFVLNILLPATSRCLLPNPDETKRDEKIPAEASGSADPPDSPEHPPGCASGLASSFSLSRRDSVMSTASTVENPESDKDLIALKSKIHAQRKRLKYYAALTPQPYFVYEHYDDTVLVEKVHRLLKTELKGLTESRGKIPMDASDLSFWLAQNLTMDDSHRTKILKMDSPIQRLRYELELLARTTRVISCRNCQTNIADQSQIFSMSIEGPQGTYVNPHGFVHETLTVYKAKELTNRGFPSTQASWFPGYSWTIVECKRCKSHIGWKFQAVGRLKPVRFWGLARRSVIFKYDFGSDSDLQQSLETQRTPPNSVNSETYATVAII